MLTNRPRFTFDFINTTHSTQFTIPVFSTASNPDTTAQAQANMAYATTKIKNLAFNKKITLGDLQVFQRELHNMTYNRNSQQTFIFTFSESTCMNNHHHNRFMTHRRHNLEEMIVRNARDNIRANQALQYVGFSSGGLLQDFILLIKLILSGHKHIQAGLISQKFEFTSEKENTITEFNKARNKSEEDQFKFLKSLKQHELLWCIMDNINRALGIHVNVDCESSWQNYHATHSKPCHVIQAIDYPRFNGHIEDLAFILRLNAQIADHGRVYFSFGTINMIFNEEGCERIESEASIPRHRLYLLDSLKRAQPNFRQKTLKQTYLLFLDDLALFAIIAPLFVRTTENQVAIYIVSNQLNPEYAETMRDYLALFIPATTEFQLRVLNKSDPLPEKFDVALFQDYSNVNFLPASNVASTASSSTITFDKAIQNCHTHNPNAMTFWVPKQSSLGICYLDTLHLFDTTENRALFKDYSGSLKIKFLARPENLEKAITDVRTFIGNQGKKLSHLFVSTQELQKQTAAATSILDTLQSDTDTWPCPDNTAFKENALEDLLARCLISGTIKIQQN